MIHASLGNILKPLIQIGYHGGEMASGDGVKRRCHPLVVLHCGDYMEEILIAGCKMGECPICVVPPNHLQDYPEEYAIRDIDKVRAALETIDTDPLYFPRACQEADIKPIVHPYWENLPYSNIFLSIPVDILHQLYQGLIKHMITWLKAAFGGDELDARCQCLPLNHHLRHFPRGFTSLSRLTGAEHSDIARFLLGLVIGLPLPGGQSPARLVRALRGLLDFLYLAQYPVHSTETLALLKDALLRFHENKSIFVELGIRQHFNFPKMHSLIHYLEIIIRFGTTDNYNTEYAERLHIDFTKDAYRATNHKDEFYQMTTWLERKEKIE